MTKILFVTSINLLWASLTSSFTEPSKVMPSRRKYMHSSSSPSSLPSPIANGRSVEEFLEILDPAMDEKLRSLVLSVFDACADISVGVSQATCDTTACYYPTPSGEEIAIDLVAEETLIEALASCGCVELASTSEQPIEEPLGGEGYSVAAAALSGDQIIDSNMALGTTVGIFAGGSSFANRVDGGLSGRDLVGALFAVYSSRTTICLALDGVEDVHEFRLLSSEYGDSSSNNRKTGSWWSHCSTYSSIESEARLVAPRNVRHVNLDRGYYRLVNNWLSRGLSLRYSGSFVPDVHQIIAKGHGIFVCCPAVVSALYYALPAAFLIEKAGGASSTGNGSSILDYRLLTPKDRLQIALGSARDVALFDQYVGSLRGEPE